ncbi:MAG: type III-B CRISPR module RAMP protein Cmr4 [Candidatus Hatepunaea meridiana]|nr:type III-B CRISPR module RAMP protein Cmr4 [Candidatus Hatepunaea meridiana]
MNGFAFLAYTYSPLHAGVGQTIGMVDLPIEREKHTNYPCVYATGLKGALRAHCKQKRGWSEEEVKKIFGDEDASAGAGGAIFTDLKILLFPVRASEGTFKWVTCEMVLERFKRDLKIAYGQECTLPNIRYLKNIEIMQNPENLNPSNHLLLEDFIFEKNNEAINREKYFLIPEITLERVYRINDDIFDYLVNHATQIIAHNILNEKKISKNLWYEETLPTDTIMYSFVKPSIASNEEQLKGFDNKLNGEIVQIGGGETVGHGITKLYLLKNHDKTR